VGSILIRAEGRAFCGGGNVSGVPPTETPIDEFNFIRELDQFTSALAGTAKPVVVAVNGLCLGAGVGFAAQGDIVLAADDARFGLIEGRIGQPGATDVVPTIGPMWAKFMIFTGEMIDAHRAKEIGLVLEVVRAAELLERATDLAIRIASVPRESAILNKACINAVDGAQGRLAGRLAGRAFDLSTKAQGRSAKAPDGRSFEDVIKQDGISGLKAARDQQFKGSWLPPRTENQE
jgi:enoyl-CoA hydratase/carnithine racemase